MTRKIIKNLKLGEVSFVTKPAQTPAIATILKSGESAVYDAIVKSISIDDGARGFNAFFEQDKEYKQKWEARETLWPAMDALRDSVNSIVADKSVSADDKVNMIASSANDFVTVVRAYIPEVQEELLKFFKLTEIENMADVAELEKALADAKAEAADLAIVAKMTDDEKKFMESMSDEAKKEFKAKDTEARKAAMDVAKAADDVFKAADGTEVRKSKVGPEIFAVLKSQHDELVKSREDTAKARDAAMTVELTKRAEDDYSHLPGETVAKVKVLKAVEGLAADVKETLVAMLKAGDDAMTGNFTTIGSEKGKQPVEKAAKVEELVKSYVDTHKVSKEQAYVEVMRSHPDLYEDK